VNSCPESVSHAEFHDAGYELRETAHEEGEAEHSLVWADFTLRIGVRKADEASIGFGNEDEKTTYPAPHWYRPRTNVVMAKPMRPRGPFTRQYIANVSYNAVATCASRRAQGEFRLRQLQDVLGYATRPYTPGLANFWNGALGTCET
jgi:hypothetical protein